MLVPASFEYEIDSYRDKGILQPVRPWNLPQQIVKTLGANLASINLFVISCSDGHQFRDITTHTFNLFTPEQKRLIIKRKLGLHELADDCFHWLARNGGPLVLTVPALQKRFRLGKEDDVAHNTLCEIDESLSLKKLNVILSLPHTCCGKALDHLHSFDEYVIDGWAPFKPLMMNSFRMDAEQVIIHPQIHRRIGRRTYHLDHSSVPLAMAA